MTGIQDLQLNIRIGESVIGRVYIPEVEDNSADGSRPLATFHIGDALQVKVIGVKMISTPNGSVILRTGFNYTALPSAWKKFAFKHVSWGMRWWVASFRSTCYKSLLPHRCHCPSRTAHPMSAETSLKFDIDVAFIDSYYYLLCLAAILIL